MSTFNDVVLRWTEERLNALLATPEMWGSKEAVEMQALLLFELQALALRPDDALARPDDVSGRTPASSASGSRGMRRRRCASSPAPRSWRRWASSAVC